MAKKMSKLETVLNETVNTTETTTESAETTAIVPAKKPAQKRTAQKAAPKAEERELDWRPIGLVKEWHSARQKLVRNQARTIDRLRLEYLAYVFGAFFAGVTWGVMICSWLG